MRGVVRGRAMAKWVSSGIYCLDWLRVVASVLANLEHPMYRPLVIFSIVLDYVTPCIWCFLVHGVASTIAHLGRSLGDLALDENVEMMSYPLHTNESNWW
jgi:hypothetical protein